MIENYADSIITKEIFDDFLKRDSYYEGRWEYYSEIIEQLKKFDDISTVLEFGPYKLPFVKGSDIIDSNNLHIDEFPFEIGNFKVHNCKKFPIPVEDKSYDLVIACQVIEHFGTFGEQIEFFNELERICDKAIISIPFLWHRPKRRDHHMIDRKMIDAWSGGRKPTFEMISGKTNNYRILQIYEFDKKGEYDISEKINEDAEIVFKSSKTYRQQNNEIKKLTEEKSRLEELNQKLQNKNKELNDKNSQLKKESDGAKRELAAMKNTASWKMTKPLRDIKSKF